MDINKMMQEIKNQPNFDQAGMVLCHNGVVRAGFEPATLESKKQEASMVSRCKRDIIAGLDYRP